jgi:transposase
MKRSEAARIGGMDRQTLRDWVHRFNQYGPEGLIDIKPPGRPSKLSEEQKEELKQLVETGPDPATDGVVRWRCVDLKRVLGRRFGVDLSEVSSNPRCAGRLAHPRLAQNQPVIITVPRY